MELLPQQSKSATRDQGMASSHATAGADCDTPIQDCQQQEQQEHQPNQQQVLQQLKLKRVLRGDTTKSYIQRPGSTTWSSVSQVCVHGCFVYACSSDSDVVVTKMYSCLIVTLI